MKIVFLNVYQGIVDRGAERSTHELAKRLAENHEVYLIQGGKPKTELNYKVKIISPIFSQISDTSLSLFRKIYLDIWSLQILFFSLLALSFLFKKHFDIIIPVNGGWQTVFCRLLTWWQKNKLIIIGRAGIGHDDAWNLLCRPDVFVALTTAAAKWAKSKSSTTTIIHIPNGIDLDVFKPEGKRAPLVLKKPIIICVAALMPNKRIELTIQAVSKLRKASLLILGDGLLKESLMDLGIKLLGKERFLLLHEEKERIADYYRAADVFTLASKTGEAFGNVYLEAMACNLPLVAIDDETRHEIIGEAGFFINPDNTNEYAGKLNNALKTDFADKPRKQAEKFSWIKVVLLYNKLFKELIKHD